MSQALILFRSTNFDGNNKLVYNVPQGLSLKNKEVALHSFSFYNSFFNISAALGNNKVDLIFPIFSTTVANTYTLQTFTWTIQDGFYSFEQLNAALQQFMITNKLYLFNAQTSKYLYFYKIDVNTVQYAVQLQFFNLPTAAQATAINFAKVSGSPLVLNISTGVNPLQVAPQISFNEAFGKVIGFNASTLPATIISKYLATYDVGAAAAGYLSIKSPCVNLVDCILLRCNISNNANSIPNDLMSVTPISSSYGAITQYVANSLLYVPCSQTTVTKIEVVMCDQNLNPILQRDAEITMVLSIRDARN
jgi:hypothetical protein